MSCVATRPLPPKICLSTVWYSTTESGVNALLTSAYPKDDETFSTFVADSKDHMISYSHRLIVYAISMKLYDSNLEPLPASYIKSFLNISKVTSSLANSPTATVSAPSGNVVLSGGAKINWSAPGNLLVASANNGSSIWYAKGKDHNQSSPATIESYVLSINNAITECHLVFNGKVALGSNTTFVKDVTSDIGSDFMGNSGYLLCGIGGEVTYTGFGRLLFAVYPYNGTTGRVASKDHYSPDLTGKTWAHATGVKHGY